MRFGVNTSPFAGRDGQVSHLPSGARALFREVRKNLAIRVEDTESADQFLVYGRGELPSPSSSRRCAARATSSQLGNPEVVTREVDGELCEPVELVVVDVPDNVRRRRHPAPRRAQGPHGADERTPASAARASSSRCPRAGSSASAASSSPRPAAWACSTRSFDGWREVGRARCCAAPTAPSWPTAPASHALRALPPPAARGVLRHAGRRPCTRA
jgi:hypothetical protein